MPYNLSVFLLKRFPHTLEPNSSALVFASPILTLVLQHLQFIYHSSVLKRHTQLLVDFIQVVLADSKRKFSINIKENECEVVHFLMG